MKTLADGSVRAAIYECLSEGYDGEHWWSWGAESLPTSTAVVLTVIVALAWISVGVAYWLGWVQ